MHGARAPDEWQAGRLVRGSGAAAARLEILAQLLARDDFALFDEYAYEPAPGPFVVPLRAYHASKDKKVTRAHVEGWRAFTSAGFSLTPLDGAKHLFLYDQADRAAFMEDVLAHLPEGFA